MACQGIWWQVRAGGNICGKWWHVGEVVASEGNRW